MERGTLRWGRKNSDTGPDFPFFTSLYSVTQHNENNNEINFATKILLVKRFPILCQIIFS